MEIEVKKEAPKYVKDTFEEYLAKKDRISASDIKTFLKSPRLYYYERFEKETDPNAPTPRHFAVGSALHELILEPKYFKQHYVIMQKFDRRTTIGKEAYAKFYEDNQDREIIDEVELEMITKMCETAIKNKTLTELIRNSHKELSVYTVDIPTGLKIRMRPDSLSTNKSTITDVKSCTKKFRGDVYKFGYSISAAFYSDFIGRENYIFAATEKTPPHQLSLFALNDEMMNYGRVQYRMGLDLIKWSIDNDFWCDYNEFELLKECYDLGTLDDFFDTLENADLITIL